MLCICKSNLINKVLGNIYKTIFKYTEKKTIAIKRYMK